MKALPRRVGEIRINLTFPMFEEHVDALRNSRDHVYVRLRMENQILEAVHEQMDREIRRIASIESPKS